MEPWGLWHRQPCQDTQHRHHQAPATTGTGSTTSTRDPRSPQLPSALSTAPGTPRASKLLLLCPPGCGPTRVPAVPMAMFPVPHCPCTPCSPVPYALQPWSSCPHGHIPSVILFPSLCPRAANGPSPCHPTLTTLSAPNPRGNPEPGTGRGDAGLRMSPQGTVALSYGPSPGGTGKVKSFVPSSWPPPSSSSALAAAEPRLWRAPGPPGSP